MTSELSAWQPPFHFSGYHFSATLSVKPSPNSPLRVRRHILAPIMCLSLTNKMRDPEAWGWLYLRVCF